MWNKLTQAAGFSSDSPEEKHEEEKEKVPSSEVQEQIDQQNLVIDQLKSLLRESEEQLKEKDKQFSELSSKYQKFQIQSKAKLTSLTNQLKGKPPKKDEGDFDDTSSSDSSDYSSRGKVILLRKQLETAKQQLDKKEKENQDIARKYELRIRELEIQLQEKKDVMVPPSDIKSTTEDSSSSKDSPQEAGVQEMYAQMVYKDSKIMELNNHILELERKILDLQEHVKEKDEVLQSRNLAVQLMSADMSRKGKSVVDELEETRGQMKHMQSNFSDIEEQWKEEKIALSSEVTNMKDKYEQQISQKENLITSLEESLKKVEAARYDLATRNAELQKKIVLAEERCEKKCDAYRKTLDEKLQELEESLKNEKSQAADLRKTLNEAASQSESKVLKARVKERTKLKALERELAALKDMQLKEQKPEEVTQLQQQVAILEEEKGTLQLRLIEVDEQISMQEKLKAENTELHHQLKESQEKIKALEDRTSLLESEKSDLESKLAVHEENWKLLQKNYEEEKERNLSLTKDFDSLSIVKGDLENNISFLEETVQEFSSRNKNLSDELVTLKEEKVSLDMKIIELEEIRENDEKQKAELLQKLKDFEEDFSSSPEYLLKEENQKLLMKCAELNDLLNSVTDCKQNLEKQMENINIELVQCRESVAETQRENSEFRTKISHVEQQFEEMKALYDEKDQQCTRLLQDAADIKDHLTSVLSQTSLENISEFPLFWKRHLDELEHFKQKYETAVTLQNEMEIAVQDRDEKLSTVIKENERLQKEVECQLQRFNEEKASLNHSLKDEIDAVAKLQAEVFEKDDLILQLNATIKQNEDNIHSLNESVQSHLQHERELEEEKSLTKQEFAEKLASESAKTQSKISSLLEQISDLEAEVSSLSNQLQEKDQFIMSLKNEILTKNLELEDCIQTQKQKELFFQNTCEEKDQMIASLQKQITTINSNSQQQQISMEQYQKATIMECEQKLEVTVSNFEKAIEEYKKERNEIGKENESLKKDIIDKEEHLKIISETNQEFQMQINKLTEQLVEAKENAQVAISRSSEELYAAREEISVLQKAICDAELAMKEKQTLNQSLLDEKTQLQNEIKVLKEEVLSLNSSMRKISEEMESLKTKCNELTDHNNKLLSVEEVMQDVKCENENLMRQSEELKLKTTELEDCLKSKDASVQEQSDTVSALQSEVRELRQSLLDKENEYLRLVSHLEALTRDNESYQSEKNSLLSAIEKKDVELKECASMNDSLKDEIRTIRENSSKSNQELDNLLLDISNANKHLERSVENLKQEKDSLECEKKLLMNDIGSLKDVIRKCEEILGHKGVQGENISLEEDLKRQTEMFMQLTRFKEECCKLIDLALDESNNPSLDLMSTESISKYVGSAALNIDSMKIRFESLSQSNAKLQAEIEHLQKHHEHLNLEHSTIKEHCENLEAANRHLREQQELSILNLNSISSKVSCIEETSIEKFRTMTLKLESLYQVIGRLSSCKEQIQSLFISYEDHKKSIHSKVQDHKLELECLMQKFGEERDVLEKHIHALKEEMQVREQKFKIINEDKKSNSELINSLEHEVKKLKEHNELLHLELSQNQENYNNNLRNLKVKLHDAAASISSLKEEIFGMKNVQGQLCVEQQQELLNAVLSVKNLQNEIVLFQSNFMQISQENSSLKKLLLEKSNEFNVMEQQSARQVSHLEVTLDKLRSSSGQELEAKNNLIQDQRSQLISLNNSLESLKLEMEKCTSEKDSICCELENLKSIESHSTALRCKYNALKQFMQSAFDTLSAVSDSEHIDISFNPVSCDADILDEDFHIVIGQFQSEIIEIWKSKKQLLNEVTHLHDKVNFLSDKLNSTNSSLQCLTHENEQLILEMATLKNAVKSFEEKSASDNDKSAVKTSGESLVETVVQKPFTPSDPTSMNVTLEQSSAEVSTVRARDVTEIENLKQELSANKVKSDKMLVKLKLFKNKIDKLSSEVQERTSENLRLHEEITEVKQKLNDADKKFEQCQKDLSAHQEEKTIEISQLENEILRLREQNSHQNLDHRRLQEELKETKQLYDQQKTEINDQEKRVHDLELTLKKSSEYVSSLETSYHDMKCKFDQSTDEKHQLEKKLENFQEQMDMIISDNDTYQTVVEKLSHSNSTLKNDLKKLNDTYQLDIDQLKSHFEKELEEKQNLLNEAVGENKSLRLEVENVSKELQLNNDALTIKLSDSHENCKKLLEQNLHLSKEMEELKKLNKSDSAMPVVDKATQHESDDVDSVAESESESREKLEYDLERYKTEVDKLANELHLMKDTIQQVSESENHWKELYCRMEICSQGVILDLQAQLDAITEHLAQNKASEDAISRLEAELQQALSSLHKQNARCEELNLEISKLLDEKNLLKQKLNQYQQQQQFEQQHHQVQFSDQVHKKEDVSLQRNANVQDTVKIDILPNESESHPHDLQLSHAQSEIAVLHQRLLETQKTCDELRKANDALDSSLTVEREQRQMIEEELGYAQRQLIPMEQSTKDEYHTLLEGFDEPEMLVEKNFSITRKVKSHAYKFRRWLRGRRMYLHRTCQRKKYSEIFYIFYMCAIHFWLLMCVVRHS